MLSIDEAIARERKLAEIYRNDIVPKEDYHNMPWIDMANEGNEKAAEEHEQLAEWLEELKQLRAYKEKMEMQYIDDIDNPLEPLKLQRALESEIFIFNYRKEHKPQDINILDYTVIYALKHCLEEQLKVGGENDRE